MPKTPVSVNVFNQIGGTYWVSRPGYFEASLASRSAPEPEPYPDTKVEHSSVHLPKTVAKPSVMVEPLLKRDALLPPSLAEALPALPAMPAIVLIGAGLDGLWQDESALGWRLWQNIMLAFGWDETQTVFFDTEHLASEEMMFSTVEEVINLGVEWVLSMDDAHEINEQLVEGVMVVNVPSLELMLSDARAKQLFYTTVRGLVD
jgi:hypothetical protein